MPVKRHASPSELLSARDRFADMLRVKTSEQQWQSFLAKNPFVLSTALPLALEPRDIRPLGRPGRAEPDFIFYPSDATPVPYYGVVELKRPDSAIVSVTRSNVAILTRDAQTAVSQGKAYAADLGRRLITPNRSLLCIGNESHIFVIMGVSTELSEKLGVELYRQQIQDGLPGNLQLIPYDVLLAQFTANINVPILVLVPDRAVASEMSDLSILPTGTVDIARSTRRGPRERRSLLSRLTSALFRGLDDGAGCG